MRCYVIGEFTNREIELGVILLWLTRVFDNASLNQYSCPSAAQNALSLPSSCLSHLAYSYSTSQHLLHPPLQATTRAVLYWSGTTKSFINTCYD
jgi:hypothetical protein